jgi:putative FmdB family regulatory protein
MQGSPEVAEVSMPFYEYECQACGTHHEAMQKMSDAPLKKCPDCGKSALVRLISAPVFRLKGGGWYETDFKSDKEKKRNLAGGEDKPASDGDSVARRKAAKKPSVDAAAKAKRAAKSTSLKAKPQPKAKKKAAKTPVRRAKAKTPRATQSSKSATPAKKSVKAVGAVKKKAARPRAAKS